ncbi:hypothetical protein V6N13_040024 [Hibiscus sabdariffa]|uniref:DUF4378 domain-containing protein n=1 Tax=Hibiscus sabdariffa TaxID=183260 RepID=A0ABR2SUC7_9ROSI
MASRTTTSQPARQLGELLQEQQEPFAIAVYLSEKRCGRKNLTSIHSHGGSGKFLNKSGCDKNKGSKSIPNFPKALKVIVCNKFFAIRGLKTKNSNDEDGNNQETAEADRFSSCNSSSDSDIDEASMFTDNPKAPELHAEREEKADVDTKSTCMEHKPQSVLEATYTSTDSNTRQKSFILPKLITEESIMSATLWGLLHQTRVREQSSCEGLEDLEASVWQQTKQLLLDCVRELVVDHKYNSGQGKAKEGFMGSEEIGNAICQQIRGWGDETSIQEMLELDVMESKEEGWSDFRIGSAKREMTLLLGNAIVEEITSEVAMDMINMT